MTSWWDFNKTATSNTAAVPAGFPLGSNPSVVHTMFQNMMAFWTEASHSIAAGGTADALTVAYTNPPAAYTDGMEILVRAASANATTTPTINVNSLGAKTMTKFGGNALAIGDIAGAAYEMKLRYNSSSGNMELLNPATANLGATASHGQCRLAYVGATSVKLSPFNGNRIVIDGVSSVIPSAGVSSANTSTFVSGTGSSNLAASTAYLVYLFNNGGTPALDFWPIAGGHITDTTAGNVGVEVRSNSGSPDSTRTLVGAVQTDSSGKFQSTSAFAGVASWFNRRQTFASTAIANATSSNSMTTVGNTAAVFQWSDSPFILAAYSGYGVITSPSAEGTVGPGLNGALALTATAQDFTNTGQFNLSYSVPVSFGSESFVSVGIQAAIGASTLTLTGTVTAAAWM